MMKMVLTGCALAMIFSALINLFDGGKPRQNANPEFPEAFYGPLYLMVAGTPFLAIFAFIGCLSARRHGVRVWLDGSLKRARRNDSWPPDFSIERAGNLQNAARLPWLAMIAMLVIIIPTLAGAACMLNMILGALVLAGCLTIVHFIARGVIATHPRECWNDPVGNSSADFPA
jgi:hypothetical protein